jgi:hypothetical protein
MIRILTVNPQASHAVQQDGPPTLEQLAGWIGVRPGYVELIPIVCGDDNEECQLWVDEEGKLRDRPKINQFATILLHGTFAKLRQMPTDVILGDCVLLSGVHKVT